MVTAEEKAAAKAAKAEEKAAAKAPFNSANVPAWVSGGLTGDGSSRKYHRAVKQLKDLNLPVTEESVRELYEKFGGKVME